jgi:hypothetical protein
MLDERIGGYKQSNGNNNASKGINLHSKLGEKIQAAQDKTHGDGQEKIFQPVPVITIDGSIPPNHIGKGEDNSDDKLHEEKKE